MQGRSEGQYDEARMQIRPAAQAQSLEGPLANVESPGGKKVRAPRAEGSRHESKSADAQENVIPAQRPEERAGGHGALVQRADVELAIFQAGILSRLVEVEKTVQRHGD